MRTDEIVETLLSQYGINGMRVINNSTSSSISYPVSYESLAIKIDLVGKEYGNVAN